MKFHLNYNPPEADFDISHTDTLMLVGSCFAENIGARLEDHKFQSLQVNPAGILFNPQSICSWLQSCLDGLPANEAMMVERDGMFYSFLHHSSINAATKKDLASIINAINKNANDFLRCADILVLTFGTAFIYDHIRLNYTVANCQKQPGSVFEKKCLGVVEITDAYATLLKNIKSVNPNLKIIFTVSPVKYLRDGIEENSISKSTLLLAIRDLVKNHDNSYYFPAFELVNDDLRDYRFYKEDLAHPNDQAIEYIWQKFSSCFFNDQTLVLNSEIHKLNQAFRHRQMTQNGSGSQKLSTFIEKQTEEIRKLNPEIEF